MSRSLATARVLRTVKTLRTLATLATARVPAAWIFWDRFGRSDSVNDPGRLEDFATTPWSSLIGTWGISSSQAYKPSLTSGVCVFESGLSDGKITVEVKINGDASQPGIGFRWSDSSNGLVAYWDGTQIQLRKYVAGVVSLIAFSAWTVAEGDAVSVVFSGSAISVYHRADLVLSAVETHNQSATKHGIYGNNAGVLATWDNFRLE